MYIQFIYRVQKNSMLKLCEVTGGTIKVGLTKVGNQEKPLNYSKIEVLFCTSLEQVFKHMAIDLDTHLSETQKRLT